MLRGRRRFVRDCGSASFAFSLGPLFGSAAQIQSRADALESGEIDHETLEFWTNVVRSPWRGPERASPPVREHIDRPLSSGAGTSTAPLLSARMANEPVFFFYGNREFQKAHLLGTDALPAKGDLEILMQILECRPSAAAYERLAKLETGSMRIDVQQGQPFPNLQDTLAWTALAALLPDPRGKVSTRGENFDLGKSWGRTQRVSFPGGFGSWTWNFFLKEKESPWTQFINFVRTASGRLAGAPILGLPAIGRTALKQIDSLLGRLQAIKSSRWVMQSRDVEIYGTREGLEKVGPRSVQLRTGEYILVPATQSDRFEEQMGGLKLVDGKLVSADTRPGQINRAAETTLPEISYLTLHLTARPKDACKCPTA